MEGKARIPQAARRWVFSQKIEDLSKSLRSLAAHVRNDITSRSTPGRTRCHVLIRRSSERRRPPKEFGNSLLPLDGGYIDLFPYVA